MEQPAGVVFVDLLFLFLGVRILYIAVSRGIICEVIKITGLLLGAFFAFQYYSLIGGTSDKSIFFLSRRYFHLVTFLVVLLGTRAIFSFLGLIVRFLFKRQDIAIFERWISLFAGGFRFSIISSLIIFVFHLSPISTTIFANSLTYRFFRNLAPRSYLALQPAINSFNPNFEMNSNVENYLNLSEDNTQVK